LKSKIHKTTSGFYLPSLVTVLLVILFIAALFGTRLLQKTAPGNIGYSERYHELVKQETLSDAEAAELELETCKFKRKRLGYLRGKSLANYEQEASAYLATCENLLPLEQSAE